MTQLSRPYITTEKKHSFDYTDICHKVVSLLFNMLSRFVIAFLPRSKHLFISWLQSQSAVILELKKIKPVGFLNYLFFLHHPQNSSNVVNGGTDEDARNEIGYVFTAS